MRIFELHIPSGAKTPPKADHPIIGGSTPTEQACAPEVQPLWASNCKFSRQMGRFATLHHTEQVPWLAMDEPIWVPTVFTKNRDRLLNQDLAREFLRRVVARATPYMSDEHFTVDGTLIEAWASQKSFQPKDGPRDHGRNFHGQARKNHTVVRNYSVRAVFSVI